MNVPKTRQQRDSVQKLHLIHGGGWVQAARLPPAYKQPSTGRVLIRPGHIPIEATTLFSPDPMRDSTDEKQMLSKSRAYSARHTRARLPQRVRRQARCVGCTGSPQSPRRYNPGRKARFQYSILAGPATMKGHTGIAIRPHRRQMESENEQQSRGGQTFAATAGPERGAEPTGEGGARKAGRGGDAEERERKRPTGATRTDRPLFGFRSCILGAHPSRLNYFARYSARSATRFCILNRRLLHGGTERSTVARVRLLSIQLLWKPAIVAVDTGPASVARQVSYQRANLSNDKPMPP